MAHDDRTPARPDSAAATWAPLARFIAREEQLAVWAAQRRWTYFIYEFARFGVKQAWACLFGGLMVALLIGTWAFYPKTAALPRYDFLVLASVAIQLAMIAWKLETREEALVILIFHVVGTVMEVFKTKMGSWIYPEPSLLRIGGVPLFTGFMYAAVGSYIARAWRLFEFQFTRYPPVWATVALGIAIYINFFAHHFLPDVRLLLFAAYALLFGRTWIYYRVHTSWRRMPVLLSTLLVAGFIWLAENVGTFTQAWSYPSQHAGWHIVPLSKLGAWYLLMIISAVLVSLINRPQTFAATIAPKIGSRVSIPRWRSPGTKSP
jgi:uncharacterized membrane protein YoaT (DUF817 family)